ncbi:MAG: NUDIX hydrolase [Candidatus Dormibacteria bacterium]
MSEATVTAAGGVVVRAGAAGAHEVLVVHRPAYDDWTLPKGKRQDSETPEENALREVWEETGYHCRLVRPLGHVEYCDRAGRQKLVQYWVMEVDSGGFTANREVDELRWLALGDACDLLSYEADRNLLRSIA